MTYALCYLIVGALVSSLSYRRGDPLHVAILAALLWLPGLAWIALKGDGPS